MIRFLPRFLVMLSLLAGPAGGAESGVSAGERPTYAVSSWDMRDGLPLNKVRAIAQTRDGYLWVGTFNGLARFDGVRFKVFDVTNTPALPNNEIESLCTDANDRLWIGDNFGGITVLSGGRFQPLRLPADWPHRPLLRLAAGKDGTMWAVNEEGSILTVPGAVPAKLSQSIASPNLFATDGDGTAWAVSDGRLCRVDLANGIVPVPGLSRVDGARALFAARGGGIWVMSDRALRRWHQNRWVEDRGPAEWGTIVLAACLETRSGSIVAGSFKEGVQIMDRARRIQRIGAANGLNDNWAYCVCEDQEGNLWVGTGNGGLHQLQPRRVTMVDTPDRWHNSAVLSVSPSSSGGLWVGTEGGGIYRLNGGQPTNVVGGAPIWQSVANSVTEDRDGQLWVGTWSSGVRIYDGHEFHSAYPAAPGRNVVFTVFAAKNRDIWVGTRAGPGRKRPGEDWQWFDHDPELAGLPVRCFAEDRSGRIWCGTDGGGVRRIAPEGVKVIRAADGLAGDYVRTLAGDGDAVWVGTRSGLSRIGRGAVRTITRRNGLPSNVICQLVDDGEGHYWVGSFGGIFRVNQAELNRCADGELSQVQCVVCDQSSGLATLEISEQGQPAGCRTADGQLWFATGQGLASIRPSDIAVNRLPPPVKIEEVTVDNHTYVPDPAANAAGEPRRAHLSLILPPGGRHYEFRYTGLSLTNPTRVAFRYRLEGVDDAWVDADTQRTAYYTQLMPGDYVFRVAARNADGVWNTAGSAVAFRVLPFFWQTVWFQIAAWMGSIGAAAAAVLITARRRTEKKLQTLERQRGLERERARIARDIHDDIGSNLTRIVMLSEAAKSELSGQISVATDLDEIGQTGRELTQQLSEIVWAVNPNHDTLDSFANYIGKYAHDFVSPAGIRCRLDLPLTLPPARVDSPVRHNVFLAFKEALNNAVRHGKPAAISVALQLQTNGFTLTLDDDGRGLPMTADSASGNGLANMRRRLAEVGGTCEVRGRSAGGVQVRFFVPLKPNS